MRGRTTQAHGITGKLGLEISKLGLTLRESFSFLAPSPSHCFVWGNLGSYSTRETKHSVCFYAGWVPVLFRSD